MTLPSRAAPETFFEWFDRAGRPALRMMGVLVVGAWGFALAVAALRSAFLGVPMPDMTGGAIPLVLGLAPNMIDLITRHREVMSGGGRSHIPFVENGPSLVNNGAIS